METSWYARLACAPMIYYADGATNRLYDNSDYSDLAILLSDGRKILVHKVVLCNNNEYFKKLCGVGSRFAVCDGVASVVPVRR
jgi:hypothetical protein